TLTIGRSIMARKGKRVSGAFWAGHLSSALFRIGKSSSLCNKVGSASFGGSAFKTRVTNSGRPVTIVGMQYWLVKQEPEDFSYSDLVKDGRTAWTGVRNFQARNNLRSMKKSDLVLYYHTGSSKEVVGITRVEKEHFPDPTATEGEWVAVDLVPVAALKKPV